MHNILDFQYYNSEQNYCTAQNKLNDKTHNVSIHNNLIDNLPIIIDTHIFGLTTAQSLVYM